MSQEWYYIVDGDRRGPVASADLYKLADAGTLKPDDLVWKDGMAAWVRAKRLKGLFGTGATKPSEGPVAERPQAAETAEERLSGRDRPRGEDEEDRPQRRRNEEDRAGEQDVVVYRPRAQGVHKVRLYLAIAGLVAAVLMMGVVLLLIFYSSPDSDTVKAGKGTAAKKISSTSSKPMPTPTSSNQGATQSQPGKRGSQDADADLAACGGCGACGGIVVVMIVVPLVILLLVVAPMYVGLWKSFEKAGEPGWPALVPIYNYMVMAKIAGKDPNYALLGLIPFAGPIFLIIITVEYCKKFEVGGGFAVGVILLPFVFWPLLGFGSARYIGGVTGRGVRRIRDEEEGEQRSNNQRGIRRRRRRHPDEEE